VISKSQKRELGPYYEILFPGNLGPGWKSNPPFLPALIPTKFEMFLGGKTPSFVNNIKYFTTPRETPVWVKTPNQGGHHKGVLEGPPAAL